jgi:hypothetical protein
MATPTACHVPLCVKTDAAGGFRVKSVELAFIKTHLSCGSGANA